MREKTRRTRRVRWLAALLGAFVLALSVMPVTAWAADGAVYVSAEGNDDNNGVDELNAVKTLAQAVKIANDGDTIYVMTDLIMTESARYYGKDLTITSGDGGPYTLTRGEDFGQIQDAARSTYNPALIEVDVEPQGPDSASLYLTNIILNDSGLREGEYFIQAASDATGSTSFGDLSGDSAISNTRIVQDAMIATYDSRCSVVLGPGSVLKNFGGMSAVRLSGGSLTMESGSEIADDSVADRTKGTEILGAEKTLYGPAGAIWMQGGSLNVNEGARIDGIVGRAIFNENGTASIGGTISNCTEDTDVWHGNGFVIYLRGEGAVATLESTGVIDGSGTTAKTGDAIALTYGVKFKTEAGSKITNLSAARAIHAQQDDFLLELNGEIADGNFGYAAVACQGTDEAGDGSKVIFGETSSICGNTTWAGAVYIQGNFDVEFHGKINENYATLAGGGVWFANNTNVASRATMYPGAEICNNVADGMGGGIIVSCASFTMEGGSISDNLAAKSNEEGGFGGGVSVRRGGYFVMNGGIIANNSAISSGGNLVLRSQDWAGLSDCYIRLNGGTVSGGKMGVTVAGESGNYTVSDGISNDISIAGANSSIYGRINHYFSADENVTIDNRNIYFDNYSFSLVEPDCEIKLGNASADAETAATNALTSQNLTTVVGSFWFQSDDAVEDFTLTAPQKADDDDSLIYDSNKPVYAAVVGVGENGLAPSGAEVRLMPTTVNDDGTISLAVPSGSANGYGVVLVQETLQQANVVSVTPADMTVYMGGNGGYKAVVDENGNAVSSNNSLPEPLFRVKLPDDVNAGELTFYNAANSWELKDVGGGLYTFVPKDPGQGAAVRVQYSDGATVVKSDEFEPTSEVYNELAISIYAGEHGSDTKAKVGSTEYAIAQGVGRLTVRAVSETPVVNEVKSTAPSAEQLATSGAVAVAPAGTTYTLNNTDVVLPEGAKPSLLFDNIIDDDETNRTALLNARIAEVDGIADGFSSQVKYLDLVDANNGNAWIAASDGVDVYWAYPEGVTASDGVKVLHFEDLHRSGSVSGFDPADIASAIVSEVEGVQKVPGGIKFHVDKASFSPFALVWDYDNGGGNPGGGGGTSTRYYEIEASAGEGGSISPSGTVRVREGGDRTFTVTPDEGWTVGDVVVDGVSYRQLGSYTFEDVRADHTISVTFMRGSDPASPDETGVSDWLNASDHVAYLHGYGDGSGKFGPENPMTRAEVAQMFYNLLLDKSRGDRPVAFEDVPEGAYYEEAVLTLASRGILNGTSPETFEPDRAITRAEFVAIAMRFSNGEFEGENPYVDVPEDAWYRDYVVGATSFGWIYGYQDGSGRFGPDDTITRGQATMVTNRMLWRSCDTAWAMGHMDQIKTFVDLPQGHYAFFDVVEATNAHDYERVGGTRFEDWTGLRE